MKKHRIATYLFWILLAEGVGGAAGLVLGVLIAIVIAGLVAALIAWLIGLPVLKLKSD